MEDLPKTEALLKKLGVSYRVNADCAKVAVVGLGMRNLPGVMARVIKALNDKKIRILQSGDSNITISILIQEHDLPEALCTLHEYFRLDSPSGEDERVLA